MTKRLRKCRHGATRRLSGLFLNSFETRSIYLLVAKALDVPPRECLVVEDSPAGVRAGLAAGSLVLAVATPLTRRKLHESGLLDDHHIVDSPAALQKTLAHLMAHHNKSH